jgi:hypothetical protein
MASTGMQLLMTSKEYSKGKATWDNVMSAAKKHKSTYNAAPVSENIYEDANAFDLLDLQDLFLLPISKKERKIIRDYLNQ